MNLYSYGFILFFSTGSRFALMQIKSVMYNLVLNFELKPNLKTQIPLKLQKTPFAILTERGVDLELIRRNNK